MTDNAIAVIVGVITMRNGDLEQDQVSQLSIFELIPVEAIHCFSMIDKKIKFLKYISGWHEKQAFQIMEELSQIIYTLETNKNRIIGISMFNFDQEKRKQEYNKVIKSFVNLLGACGLNKFVTLKVITLEKESE